MSRALIDNVKKDAYLYEIVTLTGQWKGSTCDSKVHFILTGDDDSTGVRTLDPGWKDTLRKGTVDSYVMKTPRPLGNMSFMRIWHDNSGRGNYASWYLNALLVRDMQTNEVFEFVCDRWLAQEKGDKQVCHVNLCVVQLIIIAIGLFLLYDNISCTDQLSNDLCFRLSVWSLLIIWKKGMILPTSSFTMERKPSETIIHGFQFSSGQHDPGNGKALYALYYRPIQCFIFRFTRVQRTSVCFCILFMSMLFDAIFYEIVEEGVPEGIRLGPVILSYDQIFIGIVSNLITMFPASVLIFLFKTSRTRKLRKNR